MRPSFPRSVFIGLAAMALAGVVHAGAVHAQDMGTAIVSTRTIYPGQTVTADALQEVGLNWQPNMPIVHDAAEIEGKIARRTLLAGRLIPDGSVREPYLVETGSPCTVMYVQGSLSIATKAVPLQSGSVGDMIRLRNMDSGATLTGIVLGDGTVRVGDS